MRRYESYFIFYQCTKIVYIRPLDLISIESQGFTEDQDKEKTKTPRITDEGWNSQKQLSDPVEKKKEGTRRKKRLLYPHPKALFRFSSPIGSFTE